MACSEQPYSIFVSLFQYLLHANLSLVLICIHVLTFEKNEGHITHITISFLNIKGYFYRKHTSEVDLWFLVLLFFWKLLEVVMAKNIFPLCYFACYTCIHCFCYYMNQCLAFKFLLSKTNVNSLTFILVARQKFK